jgi:Mrp family chromosome partitioning ATPase
MPSYRDVLIDLGLIRASSAPDSTIVTSVTSRGQFTGGARELAMRVSVMGRRVVLIDTDREGGTPADEPTGSGDTFGAVLEGKAQVITALVQSEHEGLSYMRAEPSDYDNTSLVVNRFETKLQDIAQLTDFVIVDAPPVLSDHGAVTASMAQHASSVIVTVGATSSANDLLSAFELIQRVRGGPHDIGVIVYHNARRRGADA